ncbi:unnamed protein product [Alopecurus aequalis]
MEKDPSRPFLVLGDIVQDYGYIDRKGFRLVKCRRQEAYGCGPNGDAIVRGLALLVRLGREDDISKSPNVCLSASDEVFHRVGSEIDDRKATLYGRRLRLFASIYTVDGKVMVIRISFIASFSTNDFRSFYLVYDSAAASLSLLPRRPPSCRPSCTTTPLKVGEGNYSLVLMAEMSEERPRATSVLCLWSPPPSPDHSSSSTTPWELKGRQGGNAFPNRFQANVAFLFKGKAVWGDLSQGILYCHCSDLTDGTDPVDFKHIMLPSECRIPAQDMDMLDHCSLGVHRTMGSVGDSIWFVIIEPNFACPGDTTVKVWTLDLLSKEEDKWNLHREFNMLELFRAGHGGHVRLPETVPKFPILRQQQAHCGLYVLLPEPYTGGKAYGELVCIDLSSSYEVRLHSNRRLAIPLMNNPVILDPDFFNPLHLAA